MHLGIDASRAALPRPTGTEVYSREIISALALVAPSVRMTLYINDWADPSWSPPPGAGIRRVPAPRLWTHGRLSLEMMQAPPDVLFVPAHSLPLWHPGASVVTVHDLGYRRFPEAHGRVSRAYRLWSTRFSARSASRIIAVSESTRRDLVQLEGVAPERIRVVHHGVDASLHPVKDEIARRSAQERYGIPERYYLYLGTIQPRKNLERLISAYRRYAAAADDPAALVLAGQVGWLSQAVLRSVEESGAAGQIVLPGYIEREDVAALLSGCHAFVYPSLYEGFGMPVLEAMACGAPVIASNTSAIPEVAGQAALLVNPLQEADIENAITRIDGDELLRADLRERGLARVRAFSWERAARETLAVLYEAEREGRRSQAR